MLISAKADNKYEILNEFDVCNQAETASGIFSLAT